LVAKQFIFRCNLYFVVIQLIGLAYTYHTLIKINFCSVKINFT